MKKNKQIKLFTTWIGVIGIAIMLTACKKDPQQILLEGKTMGTTYHVKYINDGSIENLPAPETVQQKLKDLLKTVNDQMSTYQKTSEISRFNQMQQIDTPMEIAPDFAKVVAESIRLNKVTEGALDVTVGKLVNLWGFGPDKRLNKSPSQEQIDKCSTGIGIEKIILDQSDPKHPTLAKKAANLYLDLSSTAKGFGVDKLVEQLEAYGLHNYLVEIGGELRAKGKNLVGKPWVIAIEKPEFTQGISSQITFPLHDKALATSGDYRNYFEDENGNRLSHIIDPKRLKPIHHNLASISVIADSTMTADGLSTGLYVLGADKALEIAEKEKLPIFLIIKNGDNFETKMSSEFHKILENEK